MCKKTRSAQTLGHGCNAVVRGSEVRINKDMRKIAPCIYSKMEKKDLNERLKRIDLVLVDLDDCIYPGMTNVTLFKNLCLLLVCSRRIKNLFHIFRFLRFLPVLFLMKGLQLLRLGVDNPELALFFSRMIEKIPFFYLQAAAKSIPSASLLGAEEALEILSRRAKVGIISLGLDVVLEEYKIQFKGKGRQSVGFYNGSPIIQGVPQETMDKAKKARERIEEFKAEMPLVIGHNLDDFGMMKVAKEYGGLVLGFNPSRGVARVCDIVMIAEDWRPLAEYLQPTLDRDE